LQSRTFKVVVVGERRGAGISPEGKPDQVVQYAGKMMGITP